MASESEKPSLGGLFYDLVRADELQDAYNMEAEGFPPDEAGSLATFAYRQSVAPSLFLGALLPSATPSALSGSSRSLIGYIDGTLSSSQTLTHASMSNHVPGARSLCIHGVCVSRAYQRRGVAGALLKEYLRRASAATTGGVAAYDRVLLIAHEDMRGLYEGVGFEYVGRSAVVHGDKPWFEMRYIIPARAVSQAPSAISAASDLTNSTPMADIFAALRQHDSSRRARPSGELLVGFSGGVGDVVDVHEDASGGAGKSSRNKYDVLCPRKDCGSVIIKKGIGRLEERESVQMEPPDHTNPHLPTLPTPPTKTYWWLIGPTPMEFENIGFSKPINTASEKPRKLLACAECDLGPLGWCEDGTSEFWLAAGRVRYRV